MPTKTYNISAAQFASLRSQLAALGTVIPDGNWGTFNPPSHPEITLAFAYENEQLTLTIKKSAWYESADAIWNGLAPYLT